MVIISCYCYRLKATNTLDRFVKKHQVTCPICLDRYTDKTGAELSTPPIIGLLTKCGHHFHFTCVWRWLDNNPTCPVCRRKLELSESEIKAVTLREIHNREVDNKSDLSSIYVIDKSSLYDGDTLVTISDTFSDSGSYNTNSSGRRHPITTRAVTVSPRSVHITTHAVSSPSSTLSSTDNHSIISTHDAEQPDLLEHSMNSEMSHHSDQSESSDETNQRNQAMTPVEADSHVVHM